MTISDEFDNAICGNTAEILYIVSTGKRRRARNAQQNDNKPHAALERSECLR